MYEIDSLKSETSAATTLQSRRSSSRGAGWAQGGGKRLHLWQRSDTITPGSPAHDYIIVTDYNLL